MTAPRDMLRHPAFLVGLALRLVLVASLTPAPVAQWFAPFLDFSFGAHGFDPWDAWLDQGGDPRAFPYGYAMWWVFLPLTGLVRWVGLPLQLGYGCTLLLADTALLFLLRALVPGRDRLLLAVYWFSPIVVAATYVLGFNDLIPVCLLVAALVALKRHRLGLAGAGAVAALSAKFSMVIALPFMLVYFAHNRALRGHWRRFFGGLAVAALVLLLPFLFSPGGMEMVFNNPETGKIYFLALPLGGDIHIYGVPLAYLLLLYGAWRVRRINFELFQAFLGLAFLLLVLLTPASPGWFIWAVPLLVTYQAASDGIAVALATTFSLLYLAATFLPGTGLPGPENLGLALDGRLKSLLHTAMVATGAVLALRMARETVSRNDYFRLSRKPFVIGVAGDSGAGKDTFADALRGLFGRHSVTVLSGDDYHLWDRQKPMWQVMTHLNPMANDLERFANDLVALMDGRTIQTRHYDHQTGRMSRPRRVDSNDFIIASGLHALYLPILRECYNLSVYLDIDEGLRRHFKLLRDTQKRGHSVERVLESFEKREPDSVRFIRPQVAYADLVLSLQPIHPRMIQEGSQNLRFKLVVRSRQGISESTLLRVLVGICGLHVDVAGNVNATGTEMTVEGETSADDIALAAHLVCPRIFDFLDIEPEWQDGLLGVMQLVTLSHINQALTKRFLW